MEGINNVNKLVIIKIFEIVFTICVVFFSVQLWHSKGTQNFFVNSLLPSTLSYTNLTIENPIDYSLYPMTDEMAMETLKPSFVKVSNDTYTMEGYFLTLKIDKSSTLDYRYLKISLNDKIYLLSDLEKFEYNDIYSFVLDKNVIASSMKTYIVRLWLDTSAGNDMQAKNLVMYFDLSKETVKM